MASFPGAKQQHSSPPPSSKQRPPDIDGVKVNAKKGAKGKESTTAGQGTSDSFNKFYNKELKVSEDEIPLVLMELNESALNYINRDQFENALILLQKAHGVLEVLEQGASNSNQPPSKRDEMLTVQLFYNMAMCYQKLNQLEECALCLETCLEHLLSEDVVSFQDKSMAGRVARIKLICRVHLQLCAILSQLHKHANAMEQAFKGVQAAHLVVRDQLSICRFLARRVQFEELRAEEKQEAKKNGITKKNSEAAVLDIDSDEMEEEDQKQFMKDHSIESVDASDPIVYQSRQAHFNNLDSQVSLVERTAKKLAPIYSEVLNKIKVMEVPHESVVDGGEPSARNGGIQTAMAWNNKSTMNEESTISYAVKQKKVDPDVLLEELAARWNTKDTTPQSSLKPAKSPNKTDAKSKEQYNEKKPDLRYVLGFLNQSEVVSSLNIGNIMQIQPLQLEDLIGLRRNEQELDRFCFFETISFLIVSYFCVSTEIRFIIQLKEELESIKDTFNVEGKTKESQFWHTQSLVIACTFLPSDCPLLNHLLLSYQKHHAPANVPIPEGQKIEDKLIVIKPMKGIENCKFQPIIKQVDDVHINLPRMPYSSAAPTALQMLKEVLPKQLQPAGAQVMSRRSQVGLSSKFRDRNNTSQSRPSDSSKPSKDRFQLQPNTNTSQNSTTQKSSTTNSKLTKLSAKPVSRGKLKKISMFDGALTKFCEQIGVERTMFLNILLHGENYAQAARTPLSGKANDRSLSEDFKNLGHNAPEGPPDTRQAASLAYNNLHVTEAGKRSTTQKMTRNIKINKSQELNDSGSNVTPSQALSKQVNPQSVGQIPLGSLHQSMNVSSNRSKTSQKSLRQHQIPDYSKSDNEITAKPTSKNNLSHEVPNSHNSFNLGDAANLMLIQQNANQHMQSKNQSFVQGQSNSTSNMNDMMMKKRKKNSDRASSQNTAPTTNMLVPNTQQTAIPRQTQGNLTNGNSLQQTKVNTMQRPRSSAGYTSKSYNSTGNYVGANLAMNFASNNPANTNTSARIGTSQPNSAPLANEHHVSSQDNPGQQSVHPHKQLQQNVRKSGTVAVAGNNSSSGTLTSQQQLMHHTRSQKQIEIKRIGDVRTTQQSNSLDEYKKFVSGLGGQPPPQQNGSATNNQFTVLKQAYPGLNHNSSQQPHSLSQLNQKSKKGSMSTHTLPVATTGFISGEHAKGGSQMPVHTRSQKNMVIQQHQQVIHGQPAQTNPATTTQISQQASLYFSTVRPNQGPVQSSSSGSKKSKKEKYAQRVSSPMQPAGSGKVDNQHDQPMIFGANQSQGLIQKTASGQQVSSHSSRHAQQRSHSGSNNMHNSSTSLHHNPAGPASVGPPQQQHNDSDKMHAAQQHAKRSNENLSQVYAASGAQQKGNANFFMNQGSHSAQQKPIDKRRRSQPPQ